jgi:hypothetical protein
MPVDERGSWYRRPPGGDRGGRYRLSAIVISLPLNTNYTVVLCKIRGDVQARCLRC